MFEHMLLKPSVLKTMIDNNADRPNDFTTSPQMLLTSLVLTTLILEISTVNCLSNCGIEYIIKPIIYATLVLQML